MVDGEAAGMACRGEDALVHEGRRYPTGLGVWRGKPVRQMQQQCYISLLTMILMLIAAV